MNNESEIREPNATERMGDVAREVGQTLTGTPLNPEDNRLGAEGNDALMDPLPEHQERQPRPDEVSPDEPLGAPVDPPAGDPSKVQDPTEEDEM